MFRRKLRSKDVIGLTLTEIFMLFLFLFLILLVASEQKVQGEKRDADIREQCDKVIASLADTARDVREQLFDEVDASGTSSGTVKENVDAITDLLEELNDLAEAGKVYLSRFKLPDVWNRLDLLKERNTALRAEIAEHQDRWQKAQAEGRGCDQAEAELEAMNKRMRQYAEAERAVGANGAEELLLKVRDLQGRLKATGGKGLDKPSCWFDDEGDIEYVFEIEVRQGEFLVDPVFRRSRASQMHAIYGTVPLKPEIMSYAQFQQRMLPFLTYGKANSCRFFSKVRQDMDAPTGKEMRLLETYFYKFLMP